MGYGEPCNGRLVVEQRSRLCEVGTMSLGGFWSLLDTWKRRIIINQEAHYSAAARFKKYHYWIGSPTIIFATIAGATLLAEAKEPWIRISVGIIGLIAAALSAIQTFYSHSKQAETHRSVAARLGEVKREIEVIEHGPLPSKSEQNRIIEQISKRLSEIDKEAPIVEFSSEEKPGLNRLIEKLPLLGPRKDWPH